MPSKFIARSIAFLLVISSMSFFASSASIAASPAGINLGSASNFALLAGAAITTADPSTFTGEIGAGAAITTGASNSITGSLYAGAAITTGASNTISGSVFAGAALTVGASNVISGSQNFGFPISSTPYPAAMTALNAAMTDATSRVGTPIATEIGGATLTAGVYSPTTFFTLTGALTLDAENNPDAVFIIKSPGYISTAAGSSVVLINGAQAGNVFWVTGEYFSAGANAVLSGNIMATTYATLGAGSALTGRIFSQTSYLTLGSSTITPPIMVAPTTTTTVPETTTTTVAPTTTTTVPETTTTTEPAPTTTTTEPPVVSQSITYDSNNGGSGSISATTGNTGASVTLSDGIGFTRNNTNKRFSHWNTISGGSNSGTIYLPGAVITMPAGGLTLYAIWVQAVSA